MDDELLLPLLLATSAGLGLGGIFFAGLWWTVRKGAVSSHPSWWFGISRPLRISVVCAGFFLVANNHLQYLLPCLLGFLGARLLFIWLTRALLTSATHNVLSADQAS